MKTVIATTPSFPVLVPSTRQNQKPHSIKPAPKRVRTPLGLVVKQESVLGNVPSCNELEVDAWYADVARKLGPSSIDHKFECISSIRVALDLVFRMQKIHPELSSECKALLSVLRNIIKLVEAQYHNETWLESSPPTSITKTLRRAKNWAQTILRSPSSETVPASQIQDFRRRFQQIVKSMSAE